jgi:hypothetical protein
MPATAVAALLPNPTLSILNFLEFPLPPSPAAISKPHLLPPASAYFSSEQPNIEDPQTIRMIPLSPSEIVSSLLPHVTVLLAEHTKSTNLKLSVICAHIDSITTARRLPLWTITYWTEVLHLQTTIRRPWADTERVLQHRSQFKKRVNNQDSRNLIEQAYTMLGLLQWSGFVLGFENRETITHLTAYMTQEWLSDIHEIQMLELLRSTIHQRKGTIEVEIEGPYFYRYLKSAVEAGDSRYRDAASFARAHSLGEALQSGQ